MRPQSSTQHSIWSLPPQMLTEFYERCSKYYGAAGGQGAYGCASEDEKRLTMTLFLSIFESLAQMDYDPELFGKVPYLTSFHRIH